MLGDLTQEWLWCLGLSKTIAAYGSMDSYAILDSVALSKQRFGQYMMVLSCCGPRVGEVCLGKVIVYCIQVFFGRLKRLFLRTFEE